MPRLGTTLLGIVLAASAMPVAALADDEPAEEGAWFSTHLGEIVEVYRQLHAHPELSYREVNTARRMADELSRAGAEVTPNVGGLGVVGLIQNGRGPTVLIRADMDALPVAEETALPFASVGDDGRRRGEQGRRDARLRPRPAHGQPRRHRPMAGRPQAPLVGHRRPGRPARRGARRGARQDARRTGSTSGSRGPTSPWPCTSPTTWRSARSAIAPARRWPARRLVEIVVKGKGGHGAMPDSTIDPIVLASALVLDLQTIVSRENRPDRAGGRLRRLVPRRQQVQRHPRRGPHAAHPAGLPSGGPRPPRRGHPPPRRRIGQGPRRSGPLGRNGRRRLADRQHAVARRPRRPGLPQGIGRGECGARRPDDDRRGLRPLRQGWHPRPSCSASGRSRPNAWRRPGPAASRCRPCIPRSIAPRPSLPSARASARWLRPSWSCSRPTLKIRNSSARSCRDGGSCTRRTIGRRDTASRARSPM